MFDKKIIHYLALFVIFTLIVSSTPWFPELLFYRSFILAKLFLFFLDFLNLFELEL
jgi:hypothetical protein